MKRIAIILIFCLLFAVSAAAFTDIEDENTETAVATLESLGIVTGTSATKYSPSLTLTRAQVCTMIVRILGMEASADGYKTQNLFSDVKNGMWHAGYVNLAYREGIINGYGNGKFGPDDEVTYGQFVTILLRALGYTEGDIGKVWPADYVVFASDLGIDEDTSLTANDLVSRGDAAILLYNTLMATAKNANNAFYRSVGGYASEETVILLDTDVTDSTAGDLYACVLGSNGASMKYYTQKNAVSDVFGGSLGSLLLNKSGKVIGFIEKSAESRDITVKEAKISGITDTDGNVYKLGSNTGVISGSDVYPYGTTGHIKVDAHAGQSARFYYGDDGSILYVYLTAGVSPADTEVTVAFTGDAAAEFTEALNITQGSYSIFKNGGTANTAALAMYDTAYYDAMTDTLRVSDRTVTGYIEYASPSVSAAEAITVSGVELSVLQCAWDSLADFSFGDYVTLLLTDTNHVAAGVNPEVYAPDMYGILSKDGNSIILCGSGVTMRPKDISANTIYNGSLVKVDTSDKDRVRCIGVTAKRTEKAGDLNVAERTVGETPIAPGCAIYEWSGSGYLYSLEGVQNESSSTLDAIYWTDSVDASSVGFYHKNAAGMIDILLLTDVTGNYYQYGSLTFYEDGLPPYNALTITNSQNSNGSAKYICTNGGNGYGGIALTEFIGKSPKISSITRPTQIKNASVKDFYLSAEDEWFFVTNGASIPIAENLQIYIETTGKWESGEDGLLTALSANLVINVYYDRTLDTGAQVRLIVLTAN